MRYHRSRVNYITKADPIGIDRKITVVASNKSEVYTSFNDEISEIELNGCICNVILPEKCSYVILKFAK